MYKVSTSSFEVIVNMNRIYLNHSYLLQPCKSSLSNPRNHCRRCYVNGHGENVRIDFLILYCPQGICGYLPMIIMAHTPIPIIAALYT